MNMKLSWIEKIEKEEDIIVWMRREISQKEGKEEGEMVAGE
jgi:hypothetical protein